MVGCFERKESHHIKLPQAYKLYKPENMAGIPRLHPWNDANKNTADSTVGDGVQDGSSDGDNRSNSDIDSSGGLKPAAATKKQSAPSE